MKKWSEWKIHDGTEISPFYYVQAIDNERDIYECYAVELSWTWENFGGGPSPANIMAYRVLVPKGMDILNSLLKQVGNRCKLGEK